MRVRADEVRVGDRLWWYGSTITVTAVTPLLGVDTDEGEKVLHPSRMVQVERPPVRHRPVVAVMDSMVCPICKTDLETPGHQTYCAGFQDAQSQAAEDGHT